MDDLLAQLRQAIGEDERVSLAASGDAWVTGASRGYRYSHPGDVYAIAHDGTPARIAQGTRCGPEISAEQSSEHIARHDPARVLRWVAAAREVLDEYEAAVTAREVADGTLLQGAAQLRRLIYEKLVRALAGVYGIGVS